MFEAIFRLLGTGNERTIEVNVLSDISLMIKQRFKTNVTTISTLRVEGNAQGFDQEISRNGRIV
jgi:hypothetical protein